MKINKITIELIILTILLPILSRLMLEHVTISETLADLDSGAFGKSDELVTIEQGNFTQEELYQLLNKTDKKIAITSDAAAGDIKIRSIVFNKGYATLPMLEGRFFEKSDFFSNNYCAVIGKKVMDKTYLAGNKRYIEINGIEFRVIGVLGYECDTLLDDYIYINGYVRDDIFSSHFYQFDYYEDGSDEIVVWIAEELAQKGVNVERLSMGESYFNSLVPRLLYSRWFMVMFLCVVLCIVLLSFEWVSYQEKEVGIRRLLGASTKNILFLLLKRYFIIISLSIIIGCFYGIFFQPSYRKFLVLGYAITIPIFFTFLIIETFLILNYPLEEVMK